MAPRAYWNGHIRLSLVTFPVRLYAAVTDTDKIKLHKIDRASGRRIHYRNATDEKESVEKDEIVKGYEYEKGQFVLIEEDELEKLKAESRHTINLVQFADIRDIDPIYFDRPYFVAPDGDIAVEAFLTLRESLKESGKVALGQITLAGRERIAALRPAGRGLVLETLRYDYEVRKPQEFFRDIPDDIEVDEEQVALAQQLVESKTAKFDPAAFKDSYQEGLREIIEAKLEHRKPHLAPVPRAPGNVVNIMDALKRSLAQTKGVGGDREEKPVKRAAKRVHAPRKAAPAAKKKKKTKTR